jgi:hypothetical protein
MAETIRTLLTAFLVICGWPLLAALSVLYQIFPLAGLYLTLSRPRDLSLMAGLLTLKPIVTTPMWFGLVILSYFPPAGSRPLPNLITILPGAGLTLIALIVFRKVFSGPFAGAARTLLVLDCARWLNSYLMLRLGTTEGAQSFQCVLALLGLTLPVAFAVVAVYVCRAAARQTVSPSAAPSHTR